MTTLTRTKAKSILQLAHVKEAPVDITDVAKKLGFIVVPFDFADKQRGRLFIKDGVKAIGFNKNYALTAQRFTIAHELGHYLSGHGMHEHVYTDDEHKYFSPHFHQEKEADLLASELLMPYEFLIKDLDENGLNIEFLCGKYQVSEQAMWIRLTSLNLAEKYANKPKITKSEATS